MNQWDFFSLHKIYTHFVPKICSKGAPRRLCEECKSCRNSGISFPFFWNEVVHHWKRSIGPNAGDSITFLPSSILLLLNSLQETWVQNNVKARASVTAELGTSWNKSNEYKHTDPDTQSQYFFNAFKLRNGMLFLGTVTSS